ncbi:MAG: hypothetical protein MR303_05990 [Emergencia sp.]|nr:hypothetical protein [Emergencia sp.]
MVYKGIVKTRTQSRKMLFLAGCILLLYIEYTSKQYFYIPFTALLFMAVFHEKEHIVSEKGVDIKYSLFGITSLNRWTWDEITAMQPDFIKSRPNAELLIEKGSTLRKFIFTPEDCQAVMDFAKTMNPEIFVDSFTAEEQEQMEKEKMKRQQQLREQKAKARKAKKSHK